MKKTLVSLGLCTIVLLVVGIFAVTASFEIDEEMNKEIEGVVDKVSIGNISEEIYEYVKIFVSKRDINPIDITKISKVDFNDLPKEVNIENVGDTNLAIYQIDYNNPLEGEDKLFVITYSVEELKAQGDLIIAHDKRQFLQFGFAGEMTENGFLETATGVEGSLEKGYVMMRSGSITGLSTNLEVTVGGEGNIEIIIYKNGEQIGFRNTIPVDSMGIKEDYDIQSIDVVTFEPGDIISIYVNAPEGIIWKDVITMMEITTIN
jgi:hypothetical protein